MKTADAHLENETQTARSAALLNAGEVATLLRVKPCTVRNERLRGKLAFVQIGAHIFYTAAQVAEYLER